MARDFARDFYRSAAWRSARAAVVKRAHGLCERCVTAGRVTPGEIVHHKVALTPANIGDPRVSLGMGNLMLVCRQCHAELHGEAWSPTRPGLTFDAEGRLVEVADSPHGTRAGAPGRTGAVG